MTALLILAAVIAVVVAVFLVWVFGMISALKESRGRKSRKK